MQSALHTLSGNSPLFSFFLIIAAALPVPFLVAYIWVEKAEPGNDYLRSREFIPVRLSILALLGYVVIGIYSLQAPQPAVQLTLHLGGIFGLVLGIIICVMVKWWGTFLFSSFLPAIAFPGVTLSRLSQFLKGWFVALRTGRDRERIAPLLWPDLEWSVILRGSCMLILLIYVGWAFLIAHQTASFAIGLWSTLMIALASVLTFIYFSLIIYIPNYFKGDRLFSPLLVFLDAFTHTCLLTLIPLPPLIILAFLGGLIGSLIGSWLI
ncbi:hypothetical protein KSF_093860 [Reticulibacter mediterranei]|uniref:Uncharacterized protein n=1 Tax=Reticulibacter mediterranei TaxID=2778369 RepID=A0A8J3N855_9CHLR|nr:hypothetical protein [Reticulibacter mediterranei]GHO99338.1 hypothetical protein KSF_093860 [Reticulibacter mediterranei]